VEAEMYFKKIKKALTGIFIILFLPLVVNSFALYLFLEGELLHIHAIFGAAMLFIAVIYNFVFSATATQDFLTGGRYRQSKDVVFVKLSYFATCIVPLLVIALFIFIYIKRV